MAAERELAEDDVGSDGESVVDQLVDDEADHLVHVDLLSLDFDGDVGFVAAEGTIVSHANRLPRAVVTRDGSAGRRLSNRWRITF